MEVIQASAGTAVQAWQAFVAELDERVLFSQ